MKITERVIRFALIAMIALSVYLSFNIWLSPTMKRNNVQTSEELAQTSNTNKKAATDTFAPLRLIRHAEGKIQLTTGENLISYVQNELIHSKFGALSQTVSEDNAAYAKALESDDAIELRYVGPMLLTEYLRIYGLDMDLDQVQDSDSVYFSRIMVLLDKGKIRFFNNNRRNVYEASINVDKGKIQQLFQENEAKYLTVKEGFPVMEWQYYLTEPIKMKKYSYILASQSFTRFRDSFFKDPTDLHMNEDSRDLIYSSDTENMVISEADSIVAFQGVFHNDSEPDIYADSFQFVSPLGTTYSSLRYFDRTKDRIDYRTLIEGFPVFGPQEKGQISITFSDNGSERRVGIRTSLDTIQVPIPADEEVTIESSDKVLQTLIDHGADPSKFENMLIGYTWQSIDKVKQVVDFLPEWYVKYADEWLSAKDLQQRLDTEVE